MLVGGVVIADHVQVDVGWGGGHRAEEVDELGVGVARVAGSG